MNANGKFIVGLLTGVTVGAAIGLLLAPEKGSETIKKLEGAVKDATDDLMTYSSKTLKKAKDTAA